MIEGIRVTGRTALERARAARRTWSCSTPPSPAATAERGARFDWGLLREHPLERPFVLAGGLRPGNVGEAVGLLRPAIVDVSSGVESAPGRKDPELVRAFVEAVAAAGTVAA